MRSIYGASARKNGVPASALWVEASFFLDFLVLFDQAKRTRLQNPPDSVVSPNYMAIPCVRLNLCPSRPYPHRLQPENLLNFFGNPKP
jgi:hypothetical protein